MLGENINENYYLLPQQNSNFTFSFYSSEFVHYFLAINATKQAKGFFNSGAQRSTLAEVQFDDFRSTPTMKCPRNELVLVFQVIFI